jgi:ubiquinone/menaquinone biosynthesis C-methylase UbiE
MNKDTQTSSDYLFAHATDEIRRLKRQADFLYCYSQYLLDVGIGDVALLVAERVGPQVTVVGVDMYHGYCSTSVHHRSSAPSRLKGDGNARAHFIGG